MGCPHLTMFLHCDDTLGHFMCQASVIHQPRLLPSRITGSLNATPAYMADLV